MYPKKYVYLQCQILHIETFSWILLISFSGSKNRTFLLEKSRVVFRATGEHNFHIFYYLLLGSSNELKTKLKLGTGAATYLIGQFQYLNWSGSAPDMERMEAQYVHFFFFFFF